LGIALRATVPTFWGAFEVVKISFPKLRVQLFSLDLGKIAQAIKKLWKNHIAPAMKHALKHAGKAVKAVGKWAGQAARDVGKAAKKVITAPGRFVSKIFGGRRRRRRRRWFR